ncbi:ATP-binding protein [Nisaea sp.]|uniref:sensor histidine kinase n=1 Tax=Nisaea sp. TaxID=2024842 RepID=UPI003B517F8E
MLRSLSLRTWLFVGFAAVSWIPISVFAAWVYATASYRIEAEARDRHLVISGPLTLALEQFADDAVSAAEFIVANRHKLGSEAGLFMDFAPLLGDHGIRSVGFLGRNSRTLQKIYCPVECLQAGYIDSSLLAPLQPYLSEAASKAPGWVWSGVLPVAGGIPMLFVVKDIGPDGYAVASVATSYIRDLQSQVDLGGKGHVAIVDRHGRVLAHPLEAWEMERKDISEISLVQRMIGGEDGVGVFHSPAMDAEMLAGFSPVSGPGWSVMVPQPTSQIMAPVRSLLKAIVGLALAVGIFSTLVAWFIAGLITRGVRPLEETAARIADGEFHAPIESSSVILPAELDRVANAIDTMAEQIDEAVRARVESQARAHRVEQMDRAKSVLLANVSHEFRTPLNAIIGFSSAMKDELFGPHAARRYQEYSALIRESGEHLLALVEDIMLVASADVQSRVRATEIVDLEPVVREVFDIVSMAYGGRCQHVVTVDADSPPVEGERRQIKQLLINLLDNAEKYSPGGTTVEVRISRDLEHGTVLKVIDQGYGMTEEEAAESLQPFGRGTDPHVRQEKGAGLGLAVVLSIVERHGARMHIDSRKGEGTVVTVIFPPVRQDEVAA